MDDQTSGRAEALAAELSRVKELESRLKLALTAADADRAALRHEVHSQRTRLSLLHEELAHARQRQADLHSELDSLYRLWQVPRADVATQEAPPAETAAVPPETAPTPDQAPAVETEAPAAEEEDPAAEEEDPAAEEEAEEKQEEAAEVEEDAASDADDQPAPKVADSDGASAAAIPLQAVGAPVAIEVRDLHKQFRIPSHQMETLKERVLHPRKSRAGDAFEALNGVSFDVREGEFLGIAGPNGSGKSTLLKVLASVYAVDAGTVRVAGRVAPFIELGVGLNPELAAYDNVVVSGVMMGLEPEQARELYPDIIAFAGLEAFTNVKLKNYSSGMRVRLAFAVMAQVDADILLIDEVLAVGDAEFREKCLTRLRGLRDDGKTIVFVTHAMDTMEAQCDRAILLIEGRITHEGDPAEVAKAYTDTGATEEKPPLEVVGQ